MIKDNKVRYLCLSDIHLGHNKTTTAEIVEHLNSYFDNYSSKSVFAKLDIIFIAGDLFDQLIECSGNDLYEILEFLTNLIRFCERNKIKLRLLEGTPSHDRQQNRLINSITSINKTTADVKWIKTIYIETMEDLNLSILYVPDEYTSSTEITLNLVKDLFREKNIEQVDIAIMHGMFDYQMRDIPGKHDTHDERIYLCMVKHYINIGHIHNFSTFDRIISQGSFDRLGHGQEERKGAVMMTIRDNGSDYFEFIENKKAKVYKTIHLDDLDLDNSISKIDKIIGKLPDYSYIRIKATKIHPIFSSFTELVKRYPFIKLSKITTEDEQALKQNNEDKAIMAYNVISIRPDNVIDMILAELSEISELDKNKLIESLTGLCSL